MQYLVWNKPVLCGLINCKHILKVVQCCTIVKVCWPTIARVLLCSWSPNVPDCYPLLCYHCSHTHCTFLPPFSIVLHICACLCTVCVYFTGIFCTHILNIIVHKFFKLKILSMLFFKLFATLWPRPLTGQYPTFSCVFYGSPL